MDLQSLSLFNGMQARMDWLKERTTVLSQNVANADTPNYQARDLKPMTFERQLELADPLKVVRTSYGHQLGGGVSITPVAQNARDYYETSPDGNKVSLEEQMTKMADTGMEFQTITNLYRKHIAMMKMALGRGNG